MAPSQCENRCCFLTSIYSKNESSQCWTEASLFWCMIKTIEQLYHCKISVWHHYGSITRLTRSVSSLLVHRPVASAGTLRRPMRLADVPLLRHCTLHTCWKSIDVTGLSICNACVGVWRSIVLLYQCVKNRPTLCICRFAARKNGSVVHFARFTRLHFTQVLGKWLRKVLCANCALVLLYRT